MALVLIKIYLKKDISELGFNLKNRALSLKIFIGFAIVWVLILGIYYTLGFRYINNFKEYIAALISAFIFMLAHINYTFNPFHLSADPTKLILNLCIGLFYGIVFENTKSLLAPILMHNYEDATSSILGFVISFLHK